VVGALGCSRYCWACYSSVGALYPDPHRAAPPRPSHCARSCCTLLVRILGTCAWTIQDGRGGIAQHASTELCLCLIPPARLPPALGMMAAMPMLLMSTSKRSRQDRRQGIARPSASPGSAAAGSSPAGGQPERPLSAFERWNRARGLRRPKRQFSEAGGRSDGTSVPTAGLEALLAQMARTAAGGGDGSGPVRGEQQEPKENLAKMREILEKVRILQRPAVSDIQGPWDVVIAGAGLSGAVLAERFASQRGARVLVVDKRDHIGGNCYDYVDEETGLLVNKHGAHLFHTNNERVWRYVTSKHEWRRWDHRVVAEVDGREVCPRQIARWPQSCRNLGSLPGS